MPITCTRDLATVPHIQAHINGRRYDTALATEIGRTLRGWKWDVLMVNTHGAYFLAHGDIQQQSEDRIIAMDRETAILWACDNLPFAVVEAEFGEQPEAGEYTVIFHLTLDHLRERRIKAKLEPYAAWPQDRRPTMHSFIIGAIDHALT